VATNSIIAIISLDILFLFSLTMSLPRTRHYAITLAIRGYT
jgi:hypothetical protein